MSKPLCVVRTNEKKEYEHALTRAGRTAACAESERMCIEVRDSVRPARSATESKDERPT
jgi:hypothetical protein